MPFKMSLQHGRSNCALSLGKRVTTFFRLRKPQAHVVLLVQTPHHILYLIVRDIEKTAGEHERFEVL